MRKYAYIDKGGVLHIVEKQIDARKYSKDDRYIITEVESKHGYPVVKKGRNTTEIVVYSLEEAYINGNRTDGTKVELDNYPIVKEIYEQLI